MTDSNSSVGGTIVTGAGEGCTDGDVVAVDYRSASAITLSERKCPEEQFHHALAQPLKINVTGGLGSMMVQEEYWQQSAMYGHGDVARWDCGEGAAVAGCTAEFAGDRSSVLLLSCGRPTGDVDQQSS